MATYLGTSSFELSYTISEEFAECSYAYKMLFIGAVIVHIEFRYITIWSLGMISVHASGLSYDPNAADFSRIQVSRIADFFLNPSLKIKT